MKVIHLERTWTRLMRRRREVAMGEREVSMMNRIILLQCQSEDVKREEKVQEQLPLLPAPLKRFEGWRWK